MLSIEYLAGDIRKRCALDPEVNICDAYVRMLGDGIFETGRLVRQVRYGCRNFVLIQVYKFDASAESAECYVSVTHRPGNLYLAGGVYPKFPKDPKDGRITVVPVSSCVSTLEPIPPLERRYSAESLRLWVEVEVDAAHVAATREEMLAHLATASHLAMESTLETCCSRHQPTPGAMAPSPSIITESKYLLSDSRSHSEYYRRIGLKDDSDIGNREYTKMLARGVFRSAELCATLVYGRSLQIEWIQLYHYSARGYYVILKHFIGSCEGCSGVSRDSYLRVIRESVQRAYVTTDRKEFLRCVTDAVADLSEASSLPSYA